MSKRIICLWGGPGTGKSTTSAEIFSILKKRDYNAELVREYIKDWVWEGRELIPGDQVYISAKQARKERMYIRSGLDYIVSDSPLGLCTLYGSIYDKYEQENNACLAMLKQHHSFCKDYGYKTDHFFLQRTKKYNPEGRYQKNEDEAVEIDKKILMFLNEQGFNYESVLCDDHCAMIIVDNVLKKGIKL